MAATLHEASAVRLQWFQVRELWASLAIVSMWIAVLFTAVFGGDMHFEDTPTSMSTIPAAVGVALFASLASWAVARQGLRRSEPGS